MAAISYYLEKEVRAWRIRMGRQSVWIHAAVIAIFGIFLPWWKGADFLDPVILGAYACLGVIFAAPAAAPAFAERRPESLKEALARITVAVMYSQMLTLAILGAAFVTVYGKMRFFLPPDLETLAMCWIFGIAAAAALASTAGWITLRYGASAARSTIRVLFLGLLMVFFWRARWLPDVAGTGALIALAITGGAIAALRRTI